MKNGVRSATGLDGTAAVPFVIPSEAEGSAVQKTYRGNVFQPRLQSPFEQGRRDQEGDDPKAGQEEQVHADRSQAAVLKKNGLEAVYGVRKRVEVRDDLQPLWQP